MDRLLSMRAFQRVVEEGSFAGAARALDLSPAVVTRLVADLEQSLGTRLLHRTTRRLSLTEAGNEYGARLHSILHDIDEAEMAASAHSKELQGTVRVLSSPTMASFFIAPNIAHWRKRHPKLLLDLSIDARPLARIDAFDLTVMAADEGFDANVAARALGTSHLILCASPAYLQSAGPLRTPEDLAQHRYLRTTELPGQDLSNRRLRLEPMDRTHTSAEYVEVDITPVLRSQTFDILLQAGLDGVGLLAASELMARPFLNSGQLVHVLPQWVLGRVTGYAAMSSRKFMPAKTRAFIDFLVERASDLH